MAGDVAQKPEMNRWTDWEKMSGMLDYQLAGIELTCNSPLLHPMNHRLNNLPGKSLCI
jgi:hypothetical protein